MGLNFSISFLSLVLVSAEGFQIPVLRQAFSVMRKLERHGK